MTQALRGAAVQDHEAKGASTAAEGRQVNELSEISIDSDRAASAGALKKHKGAFVFGHFSSTRDACGFEI